LDAEIAKLQGKNANLEFKYTELEATNAMLEASNSELKANNAGLKAENANWVAMYTVLEMEKDAGEEVHNNALKDAEEKVRELEASLLELEKRRTSCASEVGAPNHGKRERPADAEDGANGQDADQPGSKSRRCAV